MTWFLLYTLDIEKEKTTQNENKQIEDSIDILCQLILKELNKGDSSQHLIILEDVTDQTKHATEKLKKFLMHVLAPYNRSGK
jgi:hypothetical protein